MHLDKIKVGNLRFAYVPVGELAQQQDLNHLLQAVELKTGRVCLNLKKNLRLRRGSNLIALPPHKNTGTSLSHFIMNLLNYCTMCKNMANLKSLDLLPGRDFVFDFLKELKTISNFCIMN